MFLYVGGVNSGIGARDVAYWTCGPDDDDRSTLEKHLWQQRGDNPHLCDVTILCRGKEIKAHWVVLLRCRYFHSLYNSGLTERKTGLIRLDLVSPTACELVIRSIYTNTIHFEEELLEEILCLADYLRIDDLVRIIGEYIAEEITTENCFRSLNLVSKYGLEKMVPYIENFMLSRMDEVIDSSREILDQSEAFIQDLLQDSSLSYVSPIKLYTLLLMWTTYRIDERLVVFPRLFCLMDLSALTTKFVCDVVLKVKWVLKSEECMAHVETYHQKVDAGIYRPNDKSKNVLVLQHRYKHQDSSKETLALFGYIYGERKWVDLHQMEVAHAARKVHLLTKEESAPDRNPSSQKELLVVDNTFEDGTVRYYDNHYFRPEPSVELRWRCFSGCMVDMVTCQGKCFVLYNCKHTNTFAQSLWFSYGRTEVKQDILSFCSKEVRLKICASESHVFILVNFDLETPTPTSVTKFFVFDARELKCEEYEDRVEFGDYMYVEDGKVFIQAFNTRSCRAFNIAEKRWQRQRRRLSALPPGVTTEQAVKVRLDEELYVFGANIAEGPSKGLVYRYEEPVDQWEKICEMPYALASTNHADATLPTDDLCCPVDCAHWRDDTLDGLSGCTGWEGQRRFPYYY